MSKMTKKERNSAIEMLRIVAILFIILSHACVHGGFDTVNSPVSLNRILIQCGALGNLGVAIFVIITGYFYCESKISPEKIGKLFSQVWFYSLFMAAICLLGFGCKYSFGDYMQVIFPTIFTEYWFFTAYIILIILSPALNIMIANMNRKQILILTISMIIVWVVIPTFTLQYMYATEIPQFVMYYIVGAYFKRHPKNIFEKKSTRIITTVFCFVLLFMSVIVMGVLEQQFEIFIGKGSLFFAGNSLLIVGCAIGLFGIAVYHRPFYNKVINMIAGASFGVYLIHDNPMFRGVLWGRLMNNAQYYGSPLMILRIVICVLIVFMVSTLIELARQKTIARAMNRVVESIFVKIREALEKGLSKLY